MMNSLTDQLKNITINRSQKAVHIYGVVIKTLNKNTKKYIEIFEKYNINKYSQGHRIIFGIETAYIAEIDCECISGDDDYMECDSCIECICGEYLCDMCLSCNCDDATCDRCVNCKCGDCNCDVDRDCIHCNKFISNIGYNNDICVSNHEYDITHHFYKEDAWQFQRKLCQIYNDLQGGDKKEYKDTYELTVDFANIKPRLAKIGIIYGLYLCISDK
jgi:hypothetical protein